MTREAYKIDCRANIVNKQRRCNYESIRLFR